MKDRDAELRQELETHLKMATADRVACGHDPRDAAAAARREMGNLSQIQEATRDVVVIALAASYAPARRATRIEPVAALRLD